MLGAGATLRVATADKPHECHVLSPTFWFRAFADDRAAKSSQRSEPISSHVHYPGPDQRVVGHEPVRVHRLSIVEVLG